MNKSILLKYNKVERAVLFPEFLKKNELRTKRKTLTEFVNNDKGVTFNSPHEELNVVLYGKVKRAE